MNQGNDINSRIGNVNFGEHGDEFDLGE